MSRAPTPFNLPSVALNPVARPVDQFHTPDVAKPGGDNTLGQLANALSEVAPGIVDTLHTIQDREYAGQRIKATADAARFENSQALKAAVDRGDLPETANPWYNVQLKEEVAKKTAEQAATTAFDEWAKNRYAFKNPDDLNEVGSFLDQHLSTALDGTDAWEKAAMAPILQQAKQNILTQHSRVRIAEREEEREVSYTASLGSVVGQADAAAFTAAEQGDPAAVQKVAAIQAQLKQSMETAGLTMNKAKVLKLTKDAIRAQAIAQAEVEPDADKIATKLYESLGSLTTEDKADMVALRRDIQRRNLELKNIRRQEERDANDKMADDWMQSLQAEYADAVAKDPNVRFASFMTPARIESLLRGKPADVQDKLRSRFSQLIGTEQQQVGAIKSEQQDKIRAQIVAAANGADFPEKRLSLYSAYALAGGDVRDIGDLERAVRQNAWPPQTDPDIKTGLYQKLIDGSMKADDVFSLIKLHKISENDAEMFMNKVMANDAATLRAKAKAGKAGTGSEALTAYLTPSAGRVDALLTQRVWDSLPAKDVSEWNGNTDPRVDQIRNDEGLRTKIALAKAEFTDRFYRMASSPGWQTATHDEKQRATADLLNAVVTAPQYGGYTPDEWRQSVLKQQQQEAQHQRELQAKKEQERKDAEQKAVSALPDKAVDPLIKRGDEAMKGVDGNVKAALVLTKLKPDDALEPPTSWGRFSAWYARQLDKNPVANFIRERQVMATTRGPDGGPMRETYTTDKYAEALTATKILGEQIVHDDIPGRIRYAAEQIKAQGYATPEQREEIKWLYSRLREYAFARQYVGYDVEEVKKMPPGTHMQVPMFYNGADVAKRGYDVGKQLGLSTNEIANFMSRQRALLLKVNPYY